MNGWSKQSGVDQKKAEALAKGVAKTPEWATNVYEKLRSAIAPKAAASETRPQVQDKVRK